MDLFGNRPTPNKPPGFSGFNPYAAGAKRYGSGRPMPNIGPVQDKLGYSIRDRQAEARKQAILKRLKSQMSGGPMNSGIMISDWGGGY